MPVPISLLEAFSVLPDPRIERGKEHRWSELLVIAVCALLTGGESFYDMEDFAREREPWLRTFLILCGGAGTGRSEQDTGSGSSQGQRGRGDAVGKRGQAAHAREPGRLVRTPERALKPLFPGPVACLGLARSAFLLGERPLLKLGELLESRGIFLSPATFGDDRFDAFSCVLGGRPFIFLGNEKRDRARSRFDAAHELGHYSARGLSHYSDTELDQVGERA